MKGPSVLPSGLRIRMSNFSGYGRVASKHRRKQSLGTIPGTAGTMIFVRYSPTISVLFVFSSRISSQTSPYLKRGRSNPRFSSRREITSCSPT